LALKRKKNRPAPTQEPIKYQSRKGGAFPNTVHELDTEWQRAEMGGDDSREELDGEQRLEIDTRDK
jgi:hypothetical protein